MYLNISEEILKKMSALNTAREIAQQPHTWNKTIKLIKEQKDKLHTFLNQLGELGTYDIVLMGAGTSEYIGNSLEQYINKLSHFSARSVASTDMILNPSLFVNPLKNTLFISYGRSGNSPESVGSVQAANSVTQKAFHLFITCNKNGALANIAKNTEYTFAIELPEETNDLGFAMTSSFTNMLLATVLCFNLENLDEYTTKIEKLSSSVANDLNRNAEYIGKIVKEFNFERIIYLGSSCMKFFAQESALKVLELTAGRVSTLFDTLTGFRHGPKSFVNDKSLIVIYLSDDKLTRKYELDLIKELNLIGVFKSLSLNITVDNPCPTGEVNRVVTGVTIYPVEREKL